MSKIKIYTFAHKRPDFIIYQYESIVKNLTDDYEYIVFNNAQVSTDFELSKQIKKNCSDRNIKCIDIDKDYELINEYDLANKNRNFKVFHNDKYQTANIACAYPLVWAQKHIFNSDDNHICVIDSDMFFIDKENLTTHIEKHDFMFIPFQTQHVYFPWNAIFLINKNCPNKNQINWWCGLYDGVPVDVGGLSAKYLIDNPSLKKGLIYRSCVQDDNSLDFHPSDYEYISLSDERYYSILHYRSGSNWNLRSQEYHLNKTKWLKEQISYVL